MATILKVDVDDPFPLRLDTRDALDRTHEIRHVAKFIDGEDELQHCIENEWNKIGTYQLEAGHVKNYHKRKSLEAQRLEQIQCGFDDALVKAAVEHNVPQDLGHVTVKKRRKDSQITETPENASLHEENAEDAKQSATKPQQSIKDSEEEQHEEDDCSQLDTEEDSEEQSKGSINTEQMNFRKIIDGLSRERKEIEKAASDGQKKQAVEVNKGRSWIGGENIENNTICTLRLGRDRNKVGIKDLPVLVWKQVHFKKNGNVRYHLCSKVGILKGTYGREELEPQPQLNAALMGIDIREHEGKDVVTALQAQEMYLKIGGHRSFCRCIGNCGVSKSCKCKKMGKLCTSRCHGRKANLLCQLCVVEN
jgi:hypothetical protein